MSPRVSVPAVTNPLTLYRSLLAQKKIEPDPSQHRLAIHLQKLYFRLLDYSPEAEYSTRLKALSRLIDAPRRSEQFDNVATPGHPLRRNPLFAHLFNKSEDRSTRALARVLTSYEEAMKLTSPRGLLLHGEVGSGKSMLVDLLADGLPNRKKRRWHFDTFMLETLARLEQLRVSRLNASDSEHSLLWLAKDMIEKSPILFLDEFQLPDRASSKILSNLLTTFFQLGGVLIATSNRMPDELSKASGVDFTTPSRAGLMKSLFNQAPAQRRAGSAANNEYGEFVDVLKARCEIWDMEASRDWRRREAEEMSKKEEANFGGVTMSKSILGDPAAEGEEAQDIKDLGVTPTYFTIKSTADGMAWQSVINTAVAMPSGEIPWQSTTLQVYGRKVPVLHHLNGVTLWSFSALCGGMLGPADYITLASTFHTLILDNVPVLTTLQKNEARRLITLLDALYEARCKLIIRAEAGPDDIFFPEIKNATSDGSRNGESDEKDAVYPETISEIYQDQTSPFRPNISSYTIEPKTGYDPDQDSDFGPIPGKGNEIGRQVDFGMTTSFTGEDERFAYKRARSRLWEMCGSRWHSELEWHRPLPLEVRRWERSTAHNQAILKPVISSENDVKLLGSVELDRPAGLQGKLLEEREAQVANQLNGTQGAQEKKGWSHTWRMLKW